MNKNNLKRIAVFMSMIATFQSRLGAECIRPVIKCGAPMVVAYGGPGFFSKRFEENEEKKGENNSSKIKNKKFYQNPKIMVPVGIGSATVLTGITLLSLWCAGVIGEKENKKESKEPFKAPFDDYRKLVEKVKSGEILDYCAGSANYDFKSKKFNPCFDGTRNNDKGDDLRKDFYSSKSYELFAEELENPASNFIKKEENKWFLRTDHGRMEITIFFNDKKKQYDLEFLYATGYGANKFSVKLDDMGKK